MSSPNITLFGSAFNPPHLGHSLVIQEYLEAKSDTEVWLLPSIKGSFDKQIIASKHRVAMTKLLQEFLTTTSPGLVDRIKLCQIEIDLALSGQTWDAIQALKNNPEYLKQSTLYPIPDTKYQFLMGSDQLENFHQWGNHQDLLEEVQFWVYPRAGYSTNKTYPQMKEFKTSSQTITNISSSQIRSRIQQSQNTNLLLPGKISEYIKKHKLY